MDSYNFEIPILLDEEDTCSDCGRILEDGKGSICSPCNKRYQQEAMIEARAEVELLFSDEDALSYQG